MVKESTTQPVTLSTKPSALEKFDIGFEYDMSWQDAKKALRHRTQK